MQGGNLTVSNSAIKMEEKIRYYFGIAAANTNNNVDRAKYVSTMILGEYDHIINPCVIYKFDRTIEGALENYYLTKQVRYVQNLVENYVRQGNFILPDEKKEIVHRLDRFEALRKLLTELLPDYTPETILGPNTYSNR